MDRKQFLEMVAVLKSCYPRDNLLSIDKVVEVWYRQLADLDYGIAMAAVNKWIATQKWMPAVSEIRSLYVDIKCGFDTDAWSKAWESVNKVIAKYGYYRPNEAYKELEEKDPIAKEALKRLGYGNVCMSENQASERKNFRDIYCSLQAKKREEAQMPEQLRFQIDKMQNLRISGEATKQIKG